MAQVTSHNPLLMLLTTNPHPLLQPTLEYNTAALSLAKFYLDPLAQQISETQTERLKENRKKRKRGTRDEADTKPLQLKRLHVEGFKVDQVHEQARRVLDAATKEIQEGLESLHQNQSGAVNKSEVVKAVRFADEDGEDDEDDDSLEEDGYHTEESDQSEGEGNGIDNEEGVADDSIHMSDEDASEGGEDDEDEDARPVEEYVEDVHGLNDGFFSIDDFNRQSDFLEQVDARGDRDDGAASDEEDVDWDADPITMDVADNKSAKQSKKDESSEDEDDDQDGPTFGNMDLDAPEGFSNDEHAGEDDEDMGMDDKTDFANANNILYKDFFAPPLRKGGQRGGKRGPPMKHNFPEKGPEEQDVNKIMAAVHRDIFSDEELEEDDADDLSDLDSNDHRSRRSMHERRQAKLLAEIRKLEAENVAKREWTMSGEARAADRPMNSLLEEDLDFERVGKPVPIITEEVSEDIEALIKRRILAREFDEILRRRPDDLLTGPLGRRGRIEEEVQDTKSKKGLGELYEEEHLRKTDPNFIDVRDEKLKVTHREIEGLWKDVVDKLDSLSSWHYRPKPLEMSVQVRSDAPVISMEDARPSGIGDGEISTTQLAPQEVYKAGQDKDKDEVVTKGGEVLGREELSREEKKRRRRRDKERARKAGEKGNRAENGAKGQVKGKVAKKTGQADLVGELKKGGVMVIGRKGEVVDVEGNEKKERKGMTAGSLKL